MIEQLLIPGAASILTVAGIIYLFVSGKVLKYRFLGIAVIGVILALMLIAREELLYNRDISFPYCCRCSIMGVYPEKKMVKDIF